MNMLILLIRRDWANAVVGIDPPPKGCICGNNSPGAVILVDERDIEASLGSLAVLGEMRDSFHGDKHTLGAGNYN